MNQHDAVEALISDLHWQIDQMGPRGIKNGRAKSMSPTTTNVV